MITTPKIPLILMLRDREPGEEATQLWAIAEARYVADMITEGGSAYNDDADGGKSALRSCKNYLQQCGEQGKTDSSK
jgi:hypothetical protein